MFNLTCPFCDRKSKTIEDYNALLTTLEQSKVDAPISNENQNNEEINNYCKNINPPDRTSPETNEKESRAHIRPLTQVDVSTSLQVKLSSTNEFTTKPRSNGVISRQFSQGGFKTLFSDGNESGAHPVQHSLKLHPCQIQPSLHKQPGNEVEGEFEKTTKPLQKQLMSPSILNKRSYIIREKGNSRSFSLDQIKLNAQKIEERVNEFKTFGNKQQAGFAKFNFGGVRQFEKENEAMKRRLLTRILPAKDSNKKKAHSVVDTKQSFLTPLQNATKVLKEENKGIYTELANKFEKYYSPKAKKPENILNGSIKSLQPSLPLNDISRELDSLKIDDSTNISRSNSPKKLKLSIFQSEFNPQNSADFSPGNCSFQIFLPNRTNLSPFAVKASAMASIKKNYSPVSTAASNSAKKFFAKRKETSFDEMKSCFSFSPTTTQAPSFFS